MSDANLEISDGKAVSLTYTIHETGGEILEQVDTPVTYLHGSGRLLPQVEQALAGKRAGEGVTIELAKEEAFGEHLEELTYVDDLDNVPEQFRVLGAEVEMVSSQGHKRTFVVTLIEDGKLTLDGNHPFAGKALTFHVNVLEVRVPTEQERAALQTGSDTLQ